VADSDRQVSKNLKQLSEIHRQHRDLASKINQLNQLIDKTYGLSVKLVPKKGIYCVEEGWLKSVEEVPGSLDQIDKVEFMTQPEPKVKIIYNKQDILILD
jgi:hypothetical protein